MAETMAINAVKDWKELQGIKQDDFSKRLNAGDFDKFLNDKDFVDASMKSGKLFEAPPAPTPTPDIAAPAPVTAAPVPEPTPAPVQDGQKWWEKEGFATEAEAVSSYNNLREISDKKQEQIDRFNAERGRLMKSQNEEKEKIRQLEESLRKEREERSRLSTAQTGMQDFPVAPIAPIPEDGDYGSPEFKAKRDSYHKDMQTYNERMAKMINETRQENIKLKNEVSEVKNKTVGFEAIQQENVAERQRNFATEQWQRTMKEVAKLQEHDKNLGTSKAFTEINDFIRARGYEEAAKIYPKRDIDNFDRICDVIKETYNVDSDGNVNFTATPKYKSLKSAYYDILESKGELDSFLQSVRNQGAREGREQVIRALDQQGNHAVVLPPSGGQSVDIVKEISGSDIDKKLTEYSKPQYDQKMKTDPVFQDEVYGLMMRKAETDPSWRSMIPTAWLLKQQKK